MSNLATVTHLRPSQRPVERRVAEVEDGYTRLANALYEELIGADLTKNQSKVAHAICRKTYGYGKKMDRISDSQLAQIVTNGAIVIHTQRLKSDPGGNLLS
nr:replication protein [Escherichia coli]